MDTRADPREPGPDNDHVESLCRHVKSPPDLPVLPILPVFSFISFVNIIRLVSFVEARNPEYGRKYATTLSINLSVSAIG
jgi:hypothetical protein